MKDTSVISFRSKMLAAVIVVAVSMLLAATFAELIPVKIAVWIVLSYFAVGTVLTAAEIWIMARGLARLLDGRGRKEKQKKTAERNGVSNQSFSIGDPA